jgi:dTDP-4-amino-4,6-dideoxygalactose transaminase
MTGKSFAIGEAGILTTNDREVYERAIAFGHYERFRDADDVASESLKPAVGLPLGGHKYRMHQMSAAVGRVQVKLYDGQMAEIQRAMNYFWDLLGEAPGMQAIRPPADSGSTMAGWYSPHGLYRPDELGGLSVSRFAEAVQAEGVPCRPGLNRQLHTHPLFNTVDVYRHGKPTRLAHTDRDVRQPAGSLPVTECANELSYTIPWFKHFRPAVIEQYAAAYRKVAEHAHELIEGDRGNPPDLGDWHSSTRS